MSTGSDRRLSLQNFLKFVLIIWGWFTLLVYLVGFFFITFTLLFDYALTSGS